MESCGACDVSLTFNVADLITNANTISHMHPVKLKFICYLVLPNNIVLVCYAAMQIKIHFRRMMYLYFLNAGGLVFDHY